MMWEEHDDMLIIHFCALLFMAYEEHDECMKNLGFLISRTCLILLARVCMKLVVSSHALVPRVAEMAEWLVDVDLRCHMYLMKRCVSWWNAPSSNVHTVRYQPETFPYYAFAFYFIHFIHVHAMLSCDFLFFLYFKNS